jgi:hypothetical protein
MLEGINRIVPIHFFRTAVASLLFVKAKLAQSMVLLMVYMLFLREVLQV